MPGEKIGCVVFAIAAVVLAMSTLNVFNTNKEGFGAVRTPASRNVIPKYASGPNLSSASSLENYQDSMVMNI